MSHQIDLRSITHAGGAFAQPLGRVAASRRSPGRITTAWAVGLRRRPLNVRRASMGRWSMRVSPPTCTRTVAVHTVCQVLHSTDQTVDVLFHVAHGLVADVAGVRGRGRHQHTRARTSSCAPSRCRTKCMNECSCDSARCRALGRLDAWSSSSSLSSSLLSVAMILSMVDVRRFNGDGPLLFLLAS